MSKNKKMLLSLPVIFVVEVIFVIILDSSGMEENYVSALSMTLFYSVLAAYALCLYFREFVDSTQRMGRREFLISSAIGSFLMLYLNIVFGAMRADVTGNLISQNEEALNAAAATLPVAAFLVYVVCGPIVEEVIFRYILQGWLRGKIKKGGAFFAVLISGTLFALGHIATPADLIQYLPIGLLLGVIYEKTRCISLVIVVHSVNNLVA